MGFFFGAGIEIMFFLVFCLVFGMVIFTLIRGFRQWNQNNHSPRLTVGAVVVAKRIDVTRRSGSTSHMSHTFTTYYVTFEVESGDRMELPVSGFDYGQLAEGDSGYLTFQGTRYLGFARQ